MLIIWSDPSMFHGAVSPWSLRIYHYEAIQGQGPFPSTRKATIHIHRGRGQGGHMGTLHCGGVGGVPAKPGSYIYIYYHITCSLPVTTSNSLHGTWPIVPAVPPAPARPQCIGTGFLIMIRNKGRECNSVFLKVVVPGCPKSCKHRSYLDLDPADWSKHISKYCHFWSETTE